MRKSIGVLICGFASILAVAAVSATAQHPSWAYGFVDTPPPAGAPAAPAAPAAAAPAAPDTTPLSVPGSDRKLTRAQANDPYSPADWFPGEHPTPPDIVTHGRRDANINACGLCHYVGGHGRQENSGIAGLPYDYFLQTMMDFKNDMRHSADPRKANTNRMIGFAKAMTDDEIKAAAKYYSSIPWTQYIRVVETKTIPKMRMNNGMFVKLEGNETEPLGMRVIESPENFERTEIRDPHSGFVAYVPTGAIKAGEALVKTGGNGKTEACATCHGPALEGLGPVPGIAGRSPSYLVRQLNDMQVGTRHGVWTALMKPVVDKLTAEDFVNIAAYVSSRPPQASARQTAAR
jgi:cytochrome c553